VTRVLFSAVDGYGHVHPLLPLAAAVRCTGGEVMLATGPELAPVMNRRGFPAQVVGGTIRAAEQEFLDRYPQAPALDPVSRMGLVAAEMFVGIAARDRVAGMRELIDSFRPDIVVHDATESAAPIAAALAGVPSAAHAVSLLSPTDALIAAVRPRLDELGAAWGVSRATDRLLTQPFLDLCPPSLRVPGVNPFIDVHAIRPQLLPTSLAGVPGEVRRLPHDRTVLVTLGTVVHGAPGVLETIVDAVEDLPVNVVVTVGPDGDPARLGSRPPHVHVARYLPFEAIIPRCAAVVSHAGAGTLLGALAAGVPSVLVPQGAEQVGNALAVQQAGAAVAFLPGELAADALHAALIQVLAPGPARQAATRLRLEIATMPSAPQVACALRRHLADQADRSRRTTTDLDVGVLLTSAVESSGTRTFASGK
jgi:UDP:flavonoid glycosyltransferase YjiC (YdhE family)